MIAELAGEDLSSFPAHISMESTASLTIHHRYLWKRVEDAALRPRTDAELAGWYEFAVIRDPAMRLWSAWQSKFLLREPRFRQLYPELQLQRPPKSAVEVHDDFSAFVSSTLNVEGAHSVFADPHFMPQAELLPGIGNDPQVKLYSTGQLARMRTNLAAHLGCEEQEIVLPRTNETPVQMVSHLIPSEVREVINSFYAADWAVFSRISPSTTTSVVSPAPREPREIAMNWLPMMWERQDRIFDIVSRYQSSSQGASRASRLARSVRLGFRKINAK